MGAWPRGLERPCSFWVPKWAGLGVLTYFYTYTHIFAEGFRLTNLFATNKLQGVIFYMHFPTGLVQVLVMPRIKFWFFSCSDELFT